MKWLVLAALLVTAVACGARTSMDSCALGGEECGCLAGWCNPGLVCVDEMCVRPGATGDGVGGALGTGGAMATGGEVGGGGRVGSGGYVGSGGRLGSGGYVGGGYVGGGGQGGSGGCTASGSWAVGGDLIVACPPIGGYIAAGGMLGSAGFAGSGGRIGTGGVSGMTGGGRSGFGGSPAGSTAFVTFMNGQATGLMDGWGWASPGAQDSLYSPTCAGQPITATTPCTTMTTWSSNNELCITGTIPALPATPTASGYSDNWGIMVAAQCQDPPGPLGGSFRTINIQLSGSPTIGLRAVVHRWGDAETANYCASVTSNTPIAFTAFNTACLDGSGTSLTLGDVPNLDWIGIQIPSGPSAIKVNLCWGAIFLIP